MKRKLSPWCKEVKKTLIDRDMTVTDLCDQVIMVLWLLFRFGERLLKNSKTPRH